MNRVFGEDFDKEVIEHCYAKMKEISLTYLEENSVKPNQYMDGMYNRCYVKYYEEGDYTLDNTDLKFIFVLCKKSSGVIKDFIDGNSDLLAIDEHENLIFKTRLKIGK